MFGESFSIVSDSEGNTQPLQDYMSSSDNLLVIGEGGIGKTTYQRQGEKSSSSTITESTICILKRKTEARKMAVKPA